MSNAVILQQFCKIDIWHAYYLHPVEMVPTDWIDPSGRPNALKTSKQETITADPLSVNTYSPWQDLSCSGTRATHSIMAKYKMFFRLNKEGFSIWVKANKINANDLLPYIPMDRPFKLMFTLKLKNPSFLNFTQIEGTSGGKSIWYFSNRADNQVGNTKYLNLSSTALTPPQNYVSSLDKVEMYSNSIRINVANLNLKSVRIRLSNPLANAEENFIADASTQALSICTFRPGQLPSGLYEVQAFRSDNTEINSLKNSIFWNAGDVDGNSFGVIELYQLPNNILGAYSLNTESQHLLSPTYTLWWQNRMSYWRYIFDKDQPAPDTADPTCNIRFETPGLRNKLISKTPMPFSNKYHPVRYCIANGTNSEETMLPNPEHTRIYPEAGEYFAEVHMGKIDYNKLIPNII